jgi:DNA-binding NarL/FixJ family response regulator
MAALSIRAEFPQVAVLVLSHYVGLTRRWSSWRRTQKESAACSRTILTNVSELGDGVRRVAVGGTVVGPEVIAKLLWRRRDRHPLEALSEPERAILAIMADGLGTRRSPIDCPSRRVPWRITSPGSLQSSA